MTKDKVPHDWRTNRDPFGPKESVEEQQMTASIHFRPVAWADAEPLFVWRNDVNTKQASFKDPPTWEQHLRWLNQELSRWPDSTFIGCLAGRPVVMIAIRDGEINIMTNPCLRGQGYAKQAVHWAQSLNNRLVAKVKVGNTVALKLFHGCGFELHGAQATPPCVILTWEAEHER